MSRSSTRSVRAWRRYRAPCCCAPARRTPGKGALWDAHRRHFGQDGDEVLVWQAATRDMNATVPQSFIDRTWPRTRRGPVRSMAPVPR